MIIPLRLKEIFPNLKKKKEGEERKRGEEERGREREVREWGGEGEEGEGERKEGRKEGGREAMCAGPPLAENAQVQVTSSQVANNSNFHNCLSSKFL